MTVTNCQRCDGSGVYNGTRRDGSTYVGPCFACQGGGPRFVRRAYRAAPIAATNLLNPVAPAGHPDAGRLAPIWNARQQAHLDAFAVAQPAAWVWLVNNRDTGNEFAASLVSGIARYGNLTPRQLDRVMINAARDTDRPAIVAPRVATAEPLSTRAELREAIVAADLPSDSEIGFIDPIPAPDVVPVAVVPVHPMQPAPVIVNLDRVRTAMESARASGLRKVRLDFGNVSMRLSGPTFRSGAGLILCYCNGAYCGHVDQGNAFRARYGAAVSADALDAFRRIGADPQAAARTHGQQTSHCSCCRRLLTDPVSVMANIGPVCARRFGWGF